MRLVAALFLSIPTLALGQLQHEAEIQRALIQRDQQSAEFAAAARGQPAPPQSLNEQQLREAIQPYPSELRPYQRQRMAEERALVFAPPRINSSENPKPLALPGGPAQGVDPVLPQGLPY
jgi:hypothetical protein